MTPSMYDILGITKDATEEEIKQAFRRRAQQTHPDKEGGSEETFKQVKEAYEVLSNPARRSNYDSTGSTKEGPTVEQEAEGVLASVFEQFLGSGMDVNPLNSLREEMDKVRSDQQRNVTKTEKTLKRTTAMAGKFKRKTAGANLFQRVLERRKQSCQDSIDAAKRNIAVCTKVLELLDQYEFEEDKEALDAVEARRRLAQEAYNQQLHQVMSGMGMGGATGFFGSADGRYSK